MIVERIRPDNLVSFTFQRVDRKHREEGPSASRKAGTRAGRIQNESDQRKHQDGAHGSGPVFF